jgi:hypothetical protein
MDELLARVEITMNFPDGSPFPGPPLGLPPETGDNPILPPEAGDNPRPRDLAVILRGGQVPTSSTDYASAGAEPAGTGDNPRRPLEKPDRDRSRSRSAQTGKQGTKMTHGAEKWLAGDNPKMVEPECLLNKVCDQSACFAVLELFHLHKADFPDLWNKENPDKTSRFDFLEDIQQWCKDVDYALRMGEDYYCNREYLAALLTLNGAEPALRWSSWQQIGSLVKLIQQKGFEQLAGLIPHPAYERLQGLTPLSLLDSLSYEL